MAASEILLTTGATPATPGTGKVKVFPTAAKELAIVDDAGVVTVFGAGGGGGAPSAHAASHAAGGSDALTLTQAQITNLTADLALKAPIASPTFTGVPAAPTAAANTSTTQVATTAFVGARDAVVTLTDGATPALDASLGKTFKLAAGGDRTIAIPTNPRAGQPIVIRHLASGAARTLALNTGTGGFRFGSDITALTQTASGKIDYIGAIYNADDNKWDVVAVAKGY